MKKTIILSLLLSLLLPSCSSVLEDLDTAVTSAETQEIELIVPPMEFDGVGVTRTTITPSDKGLSFGWAMNDVVGVYATESKANFNITQISQDSKYATFNGGGFGLIKGLPYYAFYPYQETMDKKAIPVSYSGQVQSSNGSTAHLAKFDYMASKANATADNTAVFAFSHLGAIIRFNVTGAGSDKYTSISIKSPQASFALAGNVDLTASTIKVAGQSSAMSNEMSLKLGNDGLTASGGSFLAYLCVAPVNLEGKTLTISLYSGSTHKDVTVDGKNLLAGKIYNFDCMFGNPGELPTVYENYSLELTNPVVLNYLTNVWYDENDYSYSNVKQYYDSMAYLNYRVDWPQGIRIGNEDRYNLIPGRTYTYEYVEGGKRHIATLNTTGELRQIRIDGCDNVRDLGGWHTASYKKIRYGKLYRGSELNNTHHNEGHKYKTPHWIEPSGIKMMREVLGVGAELDIRSDREVPVEYQWKSILGDDIKYKRVDLQFKDIDQGRTRGDLADMLRYVISNLKAGRSVYYHCVVGADRTGLFTHMMLGLLGVRRVYIDKDYELTTFAAQTRERTEKNYAKARAEVDKCEGSTLQEKYYRWWRDSGVSVEDLDAFLNIMLEN